MDRKVYAVGVLTLNDRQSSTTASMRNRSSTCATREQRNRKPHVSKLKNGLGTGSGGFKTMML
jgi:hypothetical protein